MLKMVKMGAREEEHLAFSNIVVSAGAAAVVLLKNAAQHLR